MTRLLFGVLCLGICVLLGLGAVSAAKNDLACKSLTAEQIVIVDAEGNEVLSGKTDSKGNLLFAKTYQTVGNTFYRATVPGGIDEARVRAIVDARLPGAWTVHPVGQSAWAFEIRRARRDRRIAHIQLQQVGRARARSLRRLAQLCRPVHRRSRGAAAGGGGAARPRAGTSRGAGGRDL